MTIFWKEKGFPFSFFVHFKEIVVLLGVVKANKRLIKTLIEAE